jgi:hypothetical protein
MKFNEIPNRLGIGKIDRRKFNGGKGRGGYRENAKRPKKSEDEKLIKRQIFFDPKILEKLTPQYFHFLILLLCNSIHLFLKN